MPTIVDLYKKAIEAGNAYSAELERVFGSESHVARYDMRGESTPELQQLSNVKKAADLTLHNACTVYRGDDLIHS